MRKPNPNVIAPAPMIVQEGYSSGEPGFFSRAKAWFYFKAVDFLCKHRLFGFHEGKEER